MDFWEVFLTTLNKTRQIPQRRLQSQGCSLLRCHLLTNADCCVTLNQNGSDSCSTLALLIFFFSVFFQSALIHPHINHSHHPPTLWVISLFFFSSLQILTSRCVGRGRTWGKPKTELCPSLTRRYSTQLYRSKDGLCLCVRQCVFILCFSFSPSLRHFVCHLCSPAVQVTDCAQRRSKTWPSCLCALPSPALPWMRCVCCRLHCHGNTKDNVAVWLHYSTPWGQTSICALCAASRSKGQHMIGLAAQRVWGGGFWYNNVNLYTAQEFSNWISMHCIFCLADLHYFLSASNSSNSYLGLHQPFSQLKIQLEEHGVIRVEIFFLFVFHLKCL